MPKRRNIESVTEEELNEIRSFLNDRPREILGFRMPTSYYYQLTSVLLEGVAGGRASCEHYTFL